MLDNSRDEIEIEIVEDDEVDANNITLMMDPYDIVCQATDPKHKAELAKFFNIEIPK